MPEITIEKMAFGGSGFGRIDGKSCFVPYTTPGDIARIKISSDRRSYLYGKIDELILPGPSRIIPPCPVFGSCGGCDWQHIAYEEQLRYKQEIYRELLWRIGKINSDNILPIVPAPNPFEYRARVQIKVRSINGSITLGFYQSGTHRIVEFPQKCIIADPAINQILPALHQLLSIAPDKDKIPQIDIMVDSDGRQLVIFHYIGASIKILHQFLLEQREKIPSVLGFFSQQGRKSTLTKVFGNGEINYPVIGCSSGTLSSSVGGFTQINYPQNLRLINTVCEWAELNGTERVLDLYCGNGNFSIPLAKLAYDLVGIEGYSPSIDDARKNAAGHGVANVKFIAMDAIEGLQGLVNNGEIFQVVTLDPPRSGSAEAVQHIVRLAPDVIIYVSCDPSTLARDLKIFCKYGYNLIKTQPFDLFPQTYHIESITLLRKT